MSRKSKANPTSTPGEVVAAGSYDNKVLVRTYSAGVHYGTLASVDGTHVRLVNARRVWRWRGANTLHELSLYGLEPGKKGYSRVSEPVPLIDLLEAIEILPCTAGACAAIENCGWAP